MKNPVRGLVRNIPVSRRLLLSFMVMSVVPILVIGSVSLVTANNGIYNKIRTYSLELVRTLKEDIANQVDIFWRMGDEINFSAVLQNGIVQYDSFSEEDRRNFSRDMDSLISSKLSRLSYLKQVMVTDLDDRLLFSNGFYPELTAMLSRGELPFDYLTNWTVKSTSNNRFVVFQRPIYSVRTNQPIANLTMFIEPDAFFRRVADINLGTGAQIWILDSTGRIVANAYHIDEQDEQEWITLRNNLPDTKTGDIIGEYTLQSQPHLLAFQPLTDTDWQIVASIPHRYLVSETKSIAMATLLAAAICFLCAVLVYRLLWHSISAPLGRLTQLLGQAVNQNFDQELLDDSRDELGYLGRTFGKITKKMKELIAQVEKEQAQKRETELNMLQAQINPHFLFNTLNSLRWTAMMSKAGNVANGLAALSELLRNTIVDKQEMVSIREELHNVENYVVIQKLRYGDCFVLETQVEDGLEACSTIKFLLQPIVENAILHGIDDSRTDNKITIAICSREDDVVVTITDNGKGFDTSQTLPKSDRRLSGIGVSNVAERLRLYFGDAYTFQIESEIGKGTVVTFDFPKIPALPAAEQQKEESL